MRTYLQSLNWGSTLFALVAVAITTTVILTDLEHRNLPPIDGSVTCDPNGEGAAAKRTRASLWTTEKRPEDFRPPGFFNSYFPLIDDTFDRLT